MGLFKRKTKTKTFTTCDGCGTVLNLDDDETFRGTLIGRPVGRADVELTVCSRECIETATWRTLRALTEEAE